MRVISGTNTFKNTYFGAAMRTMWTLMAYGLLLLAPVEAQAATLSEVTTMPVVASVQATPPQIRLDWTLNDNFSANYTVRRKLPGAQAWTTLSSTLPPGSTTYTDTTVAVGVEYEYQISHITNNANLFAYGYIASGIHVPPVDSRGAVVVLVDSAQAAALTGELSQLDANLRGDGWQVLRHDVPSSFTPPQVKALIIADNNAYPGLVKSILIIGHVAVPYSGNQAPDGHDDHRGAWPADTYYADLTGTWTDTTVNTTSATLARNHNVPGDGKFDQIYIPGYPQPILAVGRVDLRGFDSKTATNETGLLRQYLNRDHAWRTGQVVVQRKALVSDNFTSFAEAFAQNGWRLVGLVGAGNVVAANWMAVLRSNSYLWAYGCGGGNYDVAAGVATTSDFFSGPSNAVFTMLFGSYFGDWDVDNSFLRAPLAGNGLGLTCSWGGRPNVFHHRMGMGTTIGEAMFFHVGSGFYESNNSYGSVFVHQALMGDPTLRMHPMLQPGALTAAPSGSTVQLSWGASPDAGLGYHIYRASGSAQPIRLTVSPITSLNYTDTGVANGSYTYQVRAIRLESSPSGSFYNNSIGVFASTVVTPPANTSPSVAAGSDLSITLPALATLAGSASDDGLPSGTLTSTWTKQSGPGTVTFGSASTPATTATFSAAGTYVLRLTASDGSLSAFDETTVVVTAASGNGGPISVSGSGNGGGCGAGGTFLAILLFAGLGLRRRRQS